MDALLNPDTGLMIWTIVSFLILVALLKTFAWGPLLAAIEERETRLRQEREAAEAARKAAEALKYDLDTRLAEIQQKAQETLAEAVAQANRSRDEIVRTAQSEAKSLVEKGRKQLELEKDRLVKDLRTEVADLSVKAAERLMRKSVDEKVQKGVLDQFYSELEKKGSLS